MRAGKFNKHIDLWDAVNDQNYFSWEAFHHVLAQLGDLTRTPADLGTPSYMVMKKYKTHEIRRSSFLRFAMPQRLELGLCCAPPCRWYQALSIGNAVGMLVDSCGHYLRRHTLPTLKSFTTCVTYF